MKKQDNVILRRIGIILGVVLLLGCFLFWPLNSYIESPGTAADLQSFVKIKGHPDRYKGSFMLTSVAIQRAHPATYLYVIEPTGACVPHTLWNSSNVLKA